jgi:hypothetical protein
MQISSEVSSAIIQAVADLLNADPSTDTIRFLIYQGPVILVDMGLQQYVDGDVIAIDPSDPSAAIFLPSGGSPTLGTSFSGIVSNSGTADRFSIVRSNGVTEIEYISGTVGGPNSGKDIQFNNNTWVENGTVVITKLRLIAPRS